jgi:hypothetical protein
MPKKMERVLNDFNVPEDEWAKVVFHNLSNFEQADDFVSHQPKVSIEPKQIDLPDTFYLLKNADKNDKWAEIARWYLQDRNIDPDNYPFMLSHKTNDPKLKKWIGRVIIPIYKQNKLIFFQGRDLTNNKIKKYESPPVEKDKVLYGFDRIFDYTVNIPIYITEGWFDAYHINGVAIFGNEITQPQIEWLNRANKMKVYIPDKFGDGDLGATQALNEGWSISTPDFGADIKDVDEAIKKYGKLYVLKTIADNTASGFEAETNLRMYCK